MHFKCILNIYRQNIYCQKVINFLDNMTNQQSKFRTKKWVEGNDDAHGT